MRIQDNIKISFFVLVPSAPVGLEASFLSSESIHLKWNKPDQPNGVINKYVIYWQPSSYSFWKEHSYIEWCKRDNVKSGVVHQSNFGKKKPLVPKGMFVLMPSSY